MELRNPANKFFSDALAFVTKHQADNEISPVIEKANQRAEYLRNLLNRTCKSLNVPYPLNEDGNIEGRRKNQVAVMAAVLGYKAIDITKLVAPETNVVSFNSSDDKPLMSNAIIEHMDLAKSLMSGDLAPKGDKISASLTQELMVLECKALFKNPESLRKDIICSFMDLLRIRHECVGQKRQLVNKVLSNMVAKSGNTQKMEDDATAEISAESHISSAPAESVTEKALMAAFGALESPQKRNATLSAAQAEALLDFAFPNPEEESLKAQFSKLLQESPARAPKPSAAGRIQDRRDANSIVSQR